MYALRPRDRLLFWILTPLWAVVFALCVASLDRDITVTPIYVERAPVAGGHPRIVGLPPWTRAARQPEPGVRIGDPVLSIGGQDLAGAGPLRTVALAWAHMGHDGVLPLEVLRDGRAERVEVAIPGTIPRWPGLLVSLGFGVAGVLGLLRLPRLRLMREAFPAFMVVALWHASSFGHAPGTLLASFALRCALLALLSPLLIRALRFFPEGTGQATRWARGWPVLLGAQALLVANTELFGVIPGGATHVASVTLVAALGATGIAVGSQNYLRASRAGRRRFKWLALGHVVALLPQATVAVLSGFDPAYGRWFLPSQVTSLAIPLAGGIGVVRGGLFDIDRLLSAAVAYLGASAMAVLALAIGVPPLATELVARGLEPESAQVLATLAVLAPLLLGTAWVRGRLVRWSERDAHRLELGVGELLHELGRCSKLQEIAAVLGERLPRLWQATGATVFAPAGDLLVPIHVTQGRDVPRTWSASGGLAEALLQAHGPIELRARLTARMSPSERSLLGSLDAAVLLPLVRGGALAGFVALGPKRDGDFYTPSDRALLGAVAERAGAALAALEASDRLEAARSLGAELQGLVAEVEEASSAKTQLLAAASHDLRQPLQALGLFLSALEERIHDPESRTLLERVRAAARTLQQMFDGLLDVARIDTGLLQPCFGPVELGPLLEAIGRDFEAVAAARGVRLRVRPTGLAVRSDPVLLRQVLQNLVVNALRYTAEGGVLVAARARGDGVRIEVWDTGPGIPEAEQERIFRAGERGSGDEEGVGLGLAIVKRIAGLLGIELELRSRVGRGTRFAVRAPRSAPQPVRAGAEADAPAPDGRRARGRLALVEDDPAVLEGLATLLRAWGHDVVAAPSGPALCLALGRHAPDAVIADLHLADGASGLEAIEAVRQQAGRAVPALVVTAEAGEVALAEVRRAGHLVLRKPVPAVRLRAALDHLLQS